MEGGGEEEILRVRARIFLPALLLVLASCVPSPDSTASPSAAPTADIRRTRLDIAYSAFVDLDVHKPSSRAALQAMVNAITREAKASGGTSDFPALEFQDSTDTQLADFKAFADAAAAFAARNPQLSPDRIADTAIAAMIQIAPDCHTSYISRTGQVFRSRAESFTGSGAQVPSSGTTVFGPDANGLQAKILPGGIAYVTFRQWAVTGTYRITDELRKALDAAVNAGARAWLFDLRGNPGGNGADAAASFFLNGEPTLKTTVKTGYAGTASANKDLRLPDRYQLPIAVVLNARSASATEVFAQSLSENKRATLVGATTVGCLGAESPTAFSDGGELDVTVEEYVGAQTGAAYNNKGIPPDIAADDASAVERAIAVLKQKL
jgi:C-terminal processing protease CtpA/Prc